MNREPGNLHKIRNQLQGEKMQKVGQDGKVTHRRTADLMSAVLFFCKLRAAVPDRREY